MGEVGFPPFSVLFVGHVVLKDENHLVWGEKVCVLEIAESAWDVEYPVEFTGILEEEVMMRSASSLQTLLNFSHRAKSLQCSRMSSMISCFFIAIRL